MNRQKHANFLQQLRKAARTLKGMKPGEVHVLSIHANYGNYQIVINNGGHGERPIEISGEIHHLFLSPDNLRALPSRQQMLSNMKGTVIMKSLTVHMYDPTGDGEHLLENDHASEISVREYINFAGNKGRHMLEKAMHSHRMSLIAYRLVQRDILKALRRQE
jgi:hypothetical protein